MSKRRGFNFGVIGVGLMGQNHARIVASLPGANLAAVADTDADKLKQMQVHYGAATFSNYQEIFPLVDAVVIAAPTSTHFAVAKTCLAAGAPTLVEKPLAATAAEAKQLADLAEEKNVLLAVGFIERFNPAFQALAKLIRKEKIIGLQFQRFSPFPERISDADVIQDMMIHDLDLFLSLFPNEEVESVKAKGEKVKSNKLDRVSATICFSSGIITKIEADRVFGEKTRKIIATTDSYVIEADLLNKRVYLRDLRTHLPSTHVTKRVDQLTVELLDFMKAVKQSTAPTVTGEAGYRAQKLAEEIKAACS